MKKDSTPLTRPTLPPLKEIFPLFKKIYKSGQLTNNKFVASFEEKAAKFLGVNNTVAVASGTDAIMIALLAINKKGQVLIPSFDFSSPMHSLILFGFEPILVDVDRETFNIDVKDLDKKITKRTVAIMAPHIFGNPCDIEQILKVAKRHKLKVIFDGAHAFGSLYKGRGIAEFGDYSTFSMTPTKVLAIGEGGLLVVRDNVNIDLLKSMRNNGDNLDRSQEVVGISSRMTEWQAAIGLAALKLLKQNISRRNKLVSYYKQLLGDLPGVSFQKVRIGNISVYQNFAIIVGDQFPVNRGALIDYLERYRIESRAYFLPLHMKKMYRHLESKYSLKNTEYVSERVLSLPLYSHMKIGEVKYVADTIKMLYKK